MKSIEDIDRLLEDADTAGQVSEKEIKRAEDKLGIVFPTSYREFLLLYGAAIFNGFEIAGLFSSSHEGESPLWSDVVELTLQKRRISHGLIPDEYIPISDDGGDYTYYIDTSSRTLEGECPIVVLGPGVDGVIVAANFVDFILKEFEGKITF